MLLLLLLLLLLPPPLPQPPPQLLIPLLMLLLLLMMMMLLLLVPYPDGRREPVAKPARLLLFPSSYYANRSEQRENLHEQGTGNAGHHSGCACAGAPSLCRGRGSVPAWARRRDGALAWLAASA
jgi:hypothetical protein